MTILKDSLNTANPNKIASAMQSLPAGAAFVADPSLFAGTVTSNIMALPTPAASLLKVYAMTGTTAGATLTIVADGATLATGECKVNAAGNVAFFATDAITSAYAYYLPEQGDLVSEQINVASSSATLAGSCRAIRLVSCTVDNGLVTGSKTILLQGATPSAGQVALGAGNSTVTFNATDVVTGTATITYLQMPGYGTAPASLASKLQTQNYGL